MNIEKNVQSPKPKQSIFVFALNIIACIGVVVLHTTLPVYTPWDSLRWVEMVALQSISISAVPIFFMISGMNLLDYRDRYPTSIFFKKRLWKTGRAFLLGSIFCYLILSLFPHLFYGGERFEKNFGLIDFFKRFLTNDINDTYWFFYSIIYLYILTPIISHVVKDKRSLQYLITLLLCISVAVPFLERFGINEIYFSVLFNWPLFTSVALLYFCIGYYIYRYVPLFKHQILISAMMLVLATLSMFIFGLWSNGYHKISGLNTHYDSYFVGINSPFCVIQAIAVFLLFEALEERFRHLSQREIKTLRTISGASLGVYLFHVLVIDWLGVNIPNQMIIMQLPFVRGVLVYSATALAVIVVKRFLSLAKRFLLRARS